jgi:hypothetical protein
MIKSELLKMEILGTSRKIFAKLGHLHRKKILEYKIWQLNKNATNKKKRIIENGNFGHLEKNIY